MLHFRLFRYGSLCRSCHSVYKQLFHSNGLPEYEENSSGQAAAGPEIVPVEGCTHVENGEGYKNHQGDNFLQYFKLSQTEPAVADTVGRHLNQVLEKCDSPADGYSDQPVPGAQVFQMRILGKGHEDIGYGQQDNRSHLTLNPAIFKSELLQRSHRLIILRIDNLPAENV